MKMIHILSIILLLFILYCKDKSTSPVTNNQSRIAYYPFNGNANDESGNENHGVIIGANLSDDRFGNRDSCFLLNGSTDYIEIPHIQILNFRDDDFTISLWVKYSTIQGEQVLIEKYIETFSDDRQGWSFTKLNNNIHVFANQYGVIPNFDFDQIQENTWHHFAIIRNYNYMLYYWNDQIIHIGLVDLSYNIDCDASLKIGHRGNPTDTPGSLDESGYYLNGKIDDIAIYNYALSSSEIDSIFHAGGWNDESDGYIEGR